MSATDEVVVADVEPAAEPQEPTTDPLLDRVCIVRTMLSLGPKRTEHRLSYDESLADAAGIELETLLLLESGIGTPRTVLAVCRALKVKPSDYFVFGA